MKKFEHICFKCVNKSLELKKPYKGLVNLSVEPQEDKVNKIIFVILRYYCFTCKNEEIIDLHPLRHPYFRTTYSKTKFKNNIKKGNYPLTTGK